MKKFEILKYFFRIFEFQKNIEKQFSHQDFSFQIFHLNNYCYKKIAALILLFWFTVNVSKNYEEMIENKILSYRI